MKTLDTICELEDAIEALCKQAPEFKSVVEKTGTPPLRRASGGFAGVLRIITGQQVSKASASAIWLRMEKFLSPLEPENFAQFDEEQYRLAGLSRPKIRTMVALTDAVTSGTLKFDTLHHLNDQQVTEHLTKIKGIGPWTAEIYLLSCLGRTDVWPAGDLALQVAAADISQAPDRLSVDQMHAIAQPWRPWRAVAARLLWAWYAELKGGVEAGVN